MQYRTYNLWEICSKHIYSVKEHKDARKGGPKKEIIEESKPGKVERNLHTFKKRSRDDFKNGDVIAKNRP